MFIIIIIIIFFSPPTLQSPPFPKRALPTKSGYLPISTASSSSALFYAYYEAQRPAFPLPSTPLLLWLQGGPGCSSLLANFFELGPFLVSPRRPSLRHNHFSWNRHFGLLFIDNPVGTGFSLATSPDDIPRNQSAVAAHLSTALQAFLSSEPSFRSRPLYITGESYAGKYVPTAAYHILRENALLPANERVNLQGVAIGNGLTHPVAQVATHAASAYFTGLISDRQKKELEQLQDAAINLTNKARWSEATTARTQVLEHLQNITGLATLYDLSKKKPYQSEMVAVLLNKEAAKEALGAKKEIKWVECSEVVGRALHEDVMKSVKFMVEELLEKKLRVLLYQGMFDLRDGVVSTEAWIKEMEWSGLERFLEAERRVWKVRGELAGYVQRWESLTQVVVYGAGHLVPADQGRSAQAMIEGWVLEDGAFSNGEEPKQVVTIGSS